MFVICASSAVPAANVFEGVVLHVVRMLIALLGNYNSGAQPLFQRHQG